MNGHKLALTLGILVVLVWLVLMFVVLRAAALNDGASGVVAVVFPSQTTPALIFDAIHNAQGRIVNSTWLDSAWIVHSEQENFVARLKEQGAWSAFSADLFRPIMVSGCFLTIDRTTP